MIKKLLNFMKKSLKKYTFFYIYIYIENLKEIIDNIM